MVNFLLLQTLRTKPLSAVLLALEPVRQPRPKLATQKQEISVLPKPRLRNADSLLSPNMLPSNQTADAMLVKTAKQAEATRNQYTGWLWFIGWWLSITYLCYALRYAGTRRGHMLLKYGPSAMFFFMAWMPLIAGPLVVYFGIPTYLTFGHQIGNALPSSCDASMAIEGPDGMPCSLKRFFQWLLHFVTQVDRNTAEFEKTWRKPVIILTVVFAFYIVFQILFAWALEREHRADTRRLREGTEGKGGKKDGQDQSV